MSIRGKDGKLLISPVAESVVLDEKCRPALENSKNGEHYDVIVVGTGAGGAAAGTEYAKAGKKVLFLEAGPGFEKRSFHRRQLSWSTANLYAKKGVQLAMGTPPILLPSGSCVGGSTVLNSAICFRPPKSRLDEWHAIHGGDHLQAEALAPVVTEVWRRLGIMPTHEGNGRINNMLLREGLAKLAATDDVEHDWIKRNAPACGGCGVCHLGCPVGAKASVDKALLPEALNYDASIQTFARVQGIRIEGGVVKGVDVDVIAPETGRPVRSQKLFADQVVVAGGALNSPVLLERSGVDRPSLGEHLFIHPASACIAEFDDNVDMWNGVPQGYYGHPKGDDRFLIESVNIGVAEFFGLFGSAGPGGEDMSKRFRRWAFAGAMIRDTTSGGSVHADGDAPGRSIQYEVGKTDVDVMKDGLALLTRAYYAAGASSVCPLVHPLVFYKKEKDALDAITRVEVATDFAHVHASHPHGTCRMGRETGPHVGVTNALGQVYGVQGLQVQDGSILPGALGVNPQVTIMSFAIANVRTLLSSQAG
ncbi:MAG: GMC family oxidoreductase [Deltaproteobacteria bacterium]|nr:GMC family oxidoreductase [Deltaproteobacteria bacterium]